MQEIFDIGRQDSIPIIISSRIERQRKEIGR